MGLLPRIGFSGISLFRKNRLDQFIQRVARRSEASVARRTAGMSQQMPIAEKRGYVRARASIIVRRELQAVARVNGQLDAAQLSRIFDAAMEIVIGTALVPAPAVQPLRIAA